MTRLIPPHPSLLALAASLIAGTVCCSPTWAQEQTPRERLQQPRTQQPRQREPRQRPPGAQRGGAAISDGIVRVQASMPAEVRMGEKFTYQITVTNATDAVSVHQLKLRQSEAEGFTIESTSVNQGQAQSGQPRRQQQQQQSSEQQKQQSSEQQKQQSSEQQKQQQKQQQQKQQSSSSGSQGGREFDLGTLEPGQTKTVSVTAAADKEGQLKSCLEIVSYRPAVCLTSEVVKPELQIVKTAPETANLCQVITMEYSVKNGGTGDIARFEVVDALPEGLVTIEGNKELRFSVDGLAAGDVRKFVARLRAERAGEYSSRAVAKAEEADLTARSQQTTTRVEAAELQASVDAPPTLYNEEPAVFTARVANTGNVAAENVQIQIQWPAEARLVRMSDPQMKQAQGSQDSSQQQMPKLAQQEQENQRRQKPETDDAGGEMQQESLVVRTLEPGQAVEFRYLIRPSGLDKIPTSIVAQYACEGAEAPKTAQAMASVDVVRLPALQIVTVDDADPVAADQQVTYTIVVTNEGDAPDKQVELKATLPDGLEFADASGPTEHSQEGSTVTFKPIESLEPGSDARYRVKAKVKPVKEQTDVVFKAELTSDSLKQAANAEEPTQLYSGQAAKE